jgi:hypothetical protein
MQKVICDMIFVCVGVMYSGEYDVCDVTQSNITNIKSFVMLVDEN